MKASCSLVTTTEFDDDEGRGGGTPSIGGDFDGPGADGTAIKACAEVGVCVLLVKKGEDEVGGN